jgi:hypothetical protein
LAFSLLPLSFFRLVNRALPRLLLLATALAGSFVVLLAALPSKTQAQSCGEPSSLRFDIVGKIVRSQLGFTQGLEFRDGQLYESTGRIGGTTQLNTISLTGQVKTLADQGTSVEIWHTSHARFETNAPILTFVTNKTNGQTSFIAGYTCTPLVRFPIADLKPGAKVMGTTIAELGAGNQPIDMILYKKDGREFVLMANTRHGVLKIATDQFGTAAGLKDPVSGTAGIPAEKIAALTEVVQLDLLDATHSVLISRVDGAMNLRAVVLP